MVSYQEFLDVMETLPVSFADLDRVELSPETYDRWKNDLEQWPISNDISDYGTIDAPSVRTTAGNEKLVYIDNRGYEKEVRL